MDTPSIKKNFAELGEIEYKLASSREELKEAMALVYKEYLTRGYILQRYYKSNLRITPHNVLAGTTTFIALKEKKVIGAITLLPDSPLGLPMDEKYKKEVDKLRRQGRKICEVGQLATQSDLFGTGLFSMFNFKKLDFVFCLFKLAFQYALYSAKFDDICVVVNPKALLFKFIPFEEIGEVKYYGFDRISIKKKPAVAKRLDLRVIQERAKKYPSLAKVFLGERLPEEIFSRRFCFNKEDLRYFFVEKSDVFNQMHPEDIDFVCGAYGLNKAEFDKLIRK
ncbi:MAG: hypothetical protein M0R66_01720 [Candidatus Omnitrophica bacterium]|nr:hypothetical protein [Candidatus Omnitrophota bacterium]